VFDAFIVSMTWFVIGFVLIGGCAYDQTLKGQEKPPVAPSARKSAQEQRETLDKLVQLYLKRDKKTEAERLESVIEDFKELKVPERRERMKFTGILCAEKESTNFLGSITGFYLQIPRDVENDIDAQIIHLATWDLKTDQFLHRAHMAMGPVFAPKLTVEVTIVYRQGGACAIIDKILAIESTRLP
jgi:hypothetical protein